MFDYSKIVYCLLIINGYIINGHSENITNYNLINTDSVNNNTNRILLKRSNPINQTVIDSYAAIDTATTTDNSVINQGSVVNENTKSNNVTIKRSNQASNNITKHNQKDINEVIEYNKREVILYVSNKIELIYKLINKVKKIKSLAMLNNRLQNNLETFEQSFHDVCLRDDSIKPEPGLEEVAKLINPVQEDQDYEESLKDLIKVCNEYIIACKDILQNMKNNKNIYNKFKNYLSDIYKILVSFSAFLQNKLPKLKLLLLNPNPTKQTLIELNRIWW